MSRKYRRDDFRRRPVKRGPPLPAPDAPPDAADPGAHWESWNDAYEGLGGRGWYEGWIDALHREQGPFVGRGPRNYKRSDTRILEDVNERLTEHGMLDATDIEVSVQNGEVTLTGHVGTRQDKRLAEDIADSVLGVKDVHNQIKIRHRNLWDQLEDLDTKRRTG